MSSRPFTIETVWAANNLTHAKPQVGGDVEGWANVRHEKGRSFRPGLFMRSE